MASANKNNGCEVSYFLTECTLFPVIQGKLQIVCLSFSLQGVLLYESWTVTTKRIFILVFPFVESTKISIEQRS